MYLCQFNIGRLKHPLTDPRMNDFTSNVSRINKMADRVGGLVYRLQDDTGNLMNRPTFNDPTIIPNLTIWETPNDLFKFLYKTHHKTFYNRREEWFEPSDKPNNCMWWCSKQYRPLDILDGEIRLKYLWNNGPSEYSFDFEYLTRNKL